MKYHKKTLRFNPNSSSVYPNLPPVSFVLKIYPTQEGMARAGLKGASSRGMPIFGGADDSQHWLGVWMDFAPSETGVIGEMFLNWESMNDETTAHECVHATWTWVRYIRVRYPKFTARKLIRGSGDGEEEELFALMHGRFLCVVMDWIRYWREQDAKRKAA